MRNDSLTNLSIELDVTNIVQNTGSTVEQGASNGEQDGSEDDVVGREFVLRGC